MDLQIDHTLLYWSALWMLGGGILFWIGAFIPPYRQWMTSDTKEYLSIIHLHRRNWFLIHTPMLVGVLLTMFALHLLPDAIAFTGNGKLFILLSANAFAFGTVFLVLNFAFRLTVTTWAAGRLAETGNIEPWFNIWFRWSNVLFGLYMVLAYLSVAFLGLAFAEGMLVPGWAVLFCLIYGFAGCAGYLIGFPLFAPPLMVHLPLMLIGIFVLMNIGPY